jgi:hypothetical protein
MAQVVPQADCFCQVLVEVEGTGYGSGYLGDLEGVSEAGHVMVTKWSDEDLCLVLESAEGL